MKQLIFKILQSISIFFIISLAGNAVAADLSGNTNSLNFVSTDTDLSVPEFTFLSREASKSLDITPIPTSEPAPLIVGTYW